METHTNDDNTVSIPLSQYVDSIIALHKLEDISRIVFSAELEYDDYAAATLLAIKAIVSAHKEGGVQE